MTAKQLDFWYWFVDRLPVKVVYFCCLKVMVYATMGKYENTEVPRLSGMEAIKRYAKDHGLEEHGE